jgi:YjbE family integral membrane protein
MNIFSLVAAGLGIVLVDLALSGDNALVIGAAASGLPPRQQRAAILWGGAGALVFRLLLAGIATLLLRIPLLEALGGLVVLGIAIRLATSVGDGKSRVRGRNDQMFSAIVTITVADVTMSLDNVLAVGALAAGNLLLLAGGLILSMALLFVASAVVALLVRRLWMLLDLAVLVLGWTAGNMIVQDPWLKEQIGQLRLGAQGQLWLEWVIYALCFAIALVATLRFHFLPQLKERQRRKAQPPAGL